MALAARDSPQAQMADLIRESAEIDDRNYTHHVRHLLRIADERRKYAILFAQRSWQHANFTK
jgi:hypothetical protein